MSDAMPANIIRKLRYTPLRDLLRGHVSGRLDVKTTIDASNLPPPAKALIHRIVKRTHLWLCEKIEVANELTAHFADGLEAGVTLSDLIAKFGHERHAAKLIRRAKKRNRPLPWHILRALTWLITATLALYAFLAARFLIGHPSPKVDYVQALNRPILATPESQRAWPIYRQAILGMGPRTYSKESENRLIEVFDARPGSKHWDKVGPWLAQHQQVIDVIHQGAEKPTLGFILGRNGSIRDEELYPKFGTSRPFAPSPYENAVVTVLLPHLSDLRILADAIATDARFARQQGDAARLIRDINTLLNLAHQMHRDSEFVVVDMVAMSFWHVALLATEQSLLDEKLKLTDTDLQNLAHLLSKPKLAADLMSFAGERIMVHDLIQRCYTDDGHGDGHMTLDGYRFLNQIDPDQRTTSPRASDFWPNLFTAAATPALAYSRREALDRYDRLMDLADANLRLPIRNANWRDYEQRVLEMYTDIENLRRPRVIILSPNLALAQARAERPLGIRDGIVVAIALELYHRQHRDYPTTLQALVPQYLPTIPEDRITGEPLHFRLRNGRPLIYSVGADREDDAGRIPRAPGGHPRPWDAVDWNIPPKKAPDGDWLLFPQPPDDPDQSQ